MIITPKITQNLNLPQDSCTQATTKTHDAGVAKGRPEHSLFSVSNWSRYTLENNGATSVGFSGIFLEFFKRQRRERRICFSVGDNYPSIIMDDIDALIAEMDPNDPGNYLRRRYRNEHLLTLTNEGYKNAMDEINSLISEIEQPAGAPAPVGETSAAQMEHVTIEEVSLYPDARAY